MSNYGEDETPSADMRDGQESSPRPITGPHMPNAFRKPGISWKVYQEYDNFGDNLLLRLPALPALRRRTRISTGAAAPG